MYFIIKRFIFLVNLLFALTFYNLRIIMNLIIIFNIKIKENIKMDFDANKVYAIPFSIEKELVEKRFLSWAYEKHELPLDVQKNAKLLEIKPFYLPIRKFNNIKCVANWEATSIWEHEEQFTEYETKIVYINKNGRECGTASSAKDYNDPNFIPQAVPKTIPKTRYKTVVDRTKPTNGTLEHICGSKFTIDTNIFGGNFNAWAEEIAINNMPKYDEYIENSTDYNNIHKLTRSNEEAFKELILDLQKEIEPFCINQIPGNRYKNFIIIGSDFTYDVDIILIPIFEVKYSYKNEEYNYFVSGIDINDNLIENYPIDNNYLINNNYFEDEIEQLSKKMKTWKKLVYLFIAGIIIGCIAAGTGIGFVLFLICLICDIVYAVKLKNGEKRIKHLQEKLDEFRNERQNSRYEFNKKEK